MINLQHYLLMSILVWLCWGKKKRLKVLPIVEDRILTVRPPRSTCNRFVDYLAFQ